MEHTPFEQQRSRMVERQLRRRGITDVRVLRAMNSIPRELFLPETSRKHAYADSAMPIGREQTISQPYMVALMSQELSVEPKHRVLEIGTGSGYQTAILARLAGEVFSVERIADLSISARHLLDELGCTNVRYRIGDGTQGWPENSPYDRILVTAGAPSCPQSLRQQLADNGRLVIPIGDRWRQDLVVCQRIGNGYREHSVCGCIFVPLLGKDGWPQ